jgi:hypothetical protein
MKIYAPKDSQQEVYLELNPSTINEDLIFLDAVTEDGEIISTLASISSEGLSLYGRVDEDLDIELDEEGRIVLVDDENSN